ncbi:MAG: hypothetical protein ACOCXP_02100 [Candidatus Dojkabacteria bacterium]
MNRKYLSVVLLIVTIALAGVAVFVSQQLADPTQDQAPGDSAAYQPGDRTACGNPCSSDADCDNVTACNQSVGRCMAPQCTEMGGPLQCRNNGCTYEVPSEQVSIYWEYPGFDTNTTNTQLVDWEGSIFQNGIPNCVFAPGSQFAGQNPGPWVIRFWKNQVPANIAGTTTADSYQQYNLGPYVNINEVNADPAVTGENIWMCCVEVDSIDRDQMTATGKIGQCAQIVDEPVSLNLAKNVTPQTSNDGFFSYQIDLSNNSQETANNIIVTDISEEIDASWIAEGSISTTLGTAAVSDGSLRWEIDSMASRTTETLRYDVQIPPSEFANISAGATNLAIAYIDSNTDGVPDPDEEIDRDSETVFVNAPNPGMEKTAAIISQNAAEATVRYSITFSPDTGDFPDLIIADRLDPGVSAAWVQNISDGGQVNLYTCEDLGYTTDLDCENTIGWTGLSANQDEFLSLSYEVVVPAANFGTFENFAIAYDDSSNNDGVPSPDEEIDRDDAIITIEEDAPPVAPGELPQTNLSTEQTMYVIALITILLAVVAYRNRFGAETFERVFGTTGELSKAGARKIGNTEISKKLGGRKGFERRLSREV